ncbi:MAG: hypothetical protein GY679_01210 [Mycoplasma sp.]|nr:hypothetical protein [Mycoplasma sp.]
MATVVTDKEKKKMSFGKVLGTIAFFVSEALVVFGVGMLVGNLIINRIFDSPLFGQLLVFQGTIITIVWGSKASSNFAKMKEKLEDVKDSRFMERRTGI